MTPEGRAPLDHGRDEVPADRLVAVERAAGATPGAKEMAMTRRPRDEASGERAARFVDIDRRSVEE